MATLYPYEVYTLIVSELIVSHFNDVAMVYPGSEEIKKNYDSELSAVQVVNGIREKLIEMVLYSANSAHCYPSGMRTRLSTS
ncbi:hypothetical protein ACMWME_20660 [Escherichia coli]